MCKHSLCGKGQGVGDKIPLPKERMADCVFLGEGILFQDVKELAPWD
jgi:hypothetical protein